MQYAWLSKIILLENGNVERINLQIQIIFIITCLAKFVLKLRVSFIWNKIRYFFFSEGENANAICGLTAYAMNCL